MKAIVRLLYRDYWNGDMTHRPYRNMMHDADTDKELWQIEQLEQAFRDAKAENGDEVEIVVRKTGRRPFGNRVWKLTEPHTYAPCEP